MKEGKAGKRRPPLPRYVVKAAVRTELEGETREQTDFSSWKLDHSAENNLKAMGSILEMQKTTSKFD